MSTPRRIDAEDTADALHSIAIHLLRKLRCSDAATGLNAPRLSALSVIVFAEPITLGRLAAAEQVRPPTMTRIVNALEAKGLVTKRSSAGDRRTVHLCATARGRRLLLAARRRRILSLSQRMATLPAEEQSTLQAAIAILNDLVGAL